MDLGHEFTPTCMAHPDTYLNKVVVGGGAGRLQLWNFAKGTLLYSFKAAESDVRTLAPLRLRWTSSALGSPMGEGALARYTSPALWRDPEAG